MNQTAGSGTPPSVGRLARSQPQISPAINTPPLTVRLSGTLPIRVTNAHPKISPPRKIPIPDERHAAFLGRRVAESDLFGRPLDVLPQSDQLDPVAGVELAAAQHGYLHVRPTDRADRYAVHVFFFQQGADGLARYPFFIDDDRQRFDREVDQFLVLDLASDPCFLFDDEPPAPADDDFVAPADDRFSGRDP